MDDQKEIKNNSKDRIVSGKAISVKANKELKKLRQKINDGSFKPAYFEWEIISKAILSFPVHLIEELKADRVSGKDFVMLEIDENYQDYLKNGGTLDFNSYLKEEVAPMIGKKRKQIKPAKNKSQLIQKDKKSGGANEKSR